MNIIKDVNYRSVKNCKHDCISIEYSNMIINIIPYKEAPNYKRISIIGGTPIDREFLDYSEYSKKQLENFQKIILQSYVFLHDKLEEAIKKSESKSTLEEIKGKLLHVRDQLRHITKYIDSYDDILEDYKDI